MRIFLRCIKLFSVSGVRKRPSVVFGLAAILLLASAAYYTLKVNLTSHRSSSKTRYQSDANRRAIARESYSDELLKSPNSNDESSRQQKHLYSEMGIPYVDLDSKNPYFPKERIVHLDLKGAPPKKEYLQRIFPMIKNLGATGILIEYEDMFPYSGTLADIAAHNHYERRDVLEIISMAERTGLKVIPLVQTFGHLEFALKRPSLLHLRENEQSPQALCPSLNASLVFIENMISQVMELHGGRTSHLHIGCDEVLHLAECRRCAARAHDDGGRAHDVIFLTHVINVAQIIQRRWPDVRPLIWDDMLRHVPDDLLSLFQIGKYVDPVVWAYSEDVYRFIPPLTWHKYGRVFQTAWTASAFKGAFGETLTAPPARRHLENNLQWLKVMKEQERRFPRGFSGIVLTGWQRYDHFAALCELLPAALPSLALALLACGGGGGVAAALGGLAAALGCPDTRPPRRRPGPPTSLRLDLNADPYMWDALKSCIFPGSQFFRATSEMNVAETEAVEFIDQVTRQKGWLTEYSVRHGWWGERAVGAAAEAERLRRRLLHAAECARAALLDVTDAHTAAEWIEQRPYPLILKLERMIADAASLRAAKTWQRRPLPPPADLARLKQSDAPIPG